MSPLNFPGDLNLKKKKEGGKEEEEEKEVPVSLGLQALKIAKNYEHMK